MSWRIIPFEEIDIVKWNSCIHYAPNGNVFGYHWFLKNTIKEWDAIVWEDYESVLAIPRSMDPGAKARNAKIPVFLRECGVYSTGLLNAKKISDGIAQFPSDIPNALIRMNIGNPIKDVSGFEVSYQKNCTISLYPEYKDIRSRYSNEVMDIAGIEDQGFHLDNQMKPEDLVHFLFLQKQSDWDRHTALRIMYNALHRGIGVIAALKDNKNQILAAGFFLFSHGRLVHMLSASYQKSKDDYLFLLFDGMIRTHAGKPMIFDLNSSANRLTGYLGAENYEFPILERKSIKNNWWSGLLDYFQGKGN